MNEEIKLKNNMLSFKVFLWFSCLFYTIAFFYGVIPIFKVNAPFVILISRDIIFLLLISFFFFSTGFKSLFYYLKSNLYYSKFLKIFYIWLAVNILYGLVYMFLKDPFDILHHHFRNILFYSLFIPFIPFFIRRKYDIQEIEKTIINISLIVSAFGIATRAFREYLDLTWDGRIISTMGDPNNLAILISLSLLLLSFSSVYPIFLRFLFSIFLCIAFVLANSVTAFLVISLAFLLFFLKKYGYKGLILVLIVPFAILFFAFAVKYISLKSFSLTFTDFSNTDKYMSDKIANIAYYKLGGNFFDIDKYKISIKDKPRTLYRREEQFALLNHGLKYVWLGDLSKKNYLKYDNQYMNFLYNFGFFMLFIHLVFFLYPAYNALFVNVKMRDYNYALASFLIAIIVFGFNGLALQNRFPLNFIMYLCISIIFIIPDLKE